MCAYRMCRPPTPAGVVSAAPVRYKTDDRVDSKIVTAAQVAMLGKLNSVCIYKYGSSSLNMDLHISTLSSAQCRRTVS